MSAHWWVGLVHVPMVGKAMSGCMSRGSCGIRTTLHRLSVDGCGTVHTLLVVSPEASQHWSLQAVGWGQISVPKWQPVGELILSNIPWGLHHQCPCPHYGPQPTFTSPVEPPRPIGRSGSGAYGVTALPWVPVHVKPCVHPPRVEFCFPQSCGAPALKPHWPSKLNVLGPSKLNVLGAPPLMPDPQAGKPDMGLRTFTPVGEPLPYNYFPVCGSPIQQVWDLIIL